MVLNGLMIIQVLDYCRETGDTDLNIYSKFVWIFHVKSSRFRTTLIARKMVDELQSFFLQSFTEHMKKYLIYYVYAFYRVSSALRWYVFYNSATRRFPSRRYNDEGTTPFSRLISQSNRPAIKKKKKRK